MTISAVSPRFAQCELKVKKTHRKMQIYVLVVLAAGCVCSAVQLQDVIRFSMEEVRAEEQTKHFDTVREEAKIREFILSSRHPWLDSVESGKAQRLESFKWGNCGAPSKELLVIESLSVTPDPIAIPGTVSVSFSAVFNQTVDAPLEVDLTLEKEVFGVWIKVPCIDNLGSCTYADVCENLSQATCPLPFIQQKVPCKCPFRKGIYNLTNASFNIQASGLPIPAGNYRFTANLSVSGAFVGCYNIEASLTD